MNDLETLRGYLAGKAGAWEDFPFGPTAMVIKVRNKMFTLISLDENPLRINLKTRPDHALYLRAAHPAIKPGYHMNKTHWNTVILDNSLPGALVREMIDESYDLVVKGMTKAEREKIDLS